MRGGGGSGARREGCPVSTCGGRECHRVKGAAQSMQEYSCIGAKVHAQSQRQSQKRYRPLLQLEFRCSGSGSESLC